MHKLYSQLHRVTPYENPKKTLRICWEHLQLADVSKFYAKSFFGFSILSRTSQMYKPYSQLPRVTPYENPKRTFCNCWGNLQLVDVSKSHKKFFLDSQSFTGLKGRCHTSLQALLAHWQATECILQSHWQATD